MMFILTKKIVVAAGLLAVLSGQFVAFGSNSNKDLADDGNQVAPLTRADFSVVKTGIPFQDGLPRDVMKQIFAQASKVGVDPRVLERVCKYWYKSMCYTIPLAGPPNKDIAGIPYTTQINDFFMEDCMRLYMEGIVSRGVLYYKKGEVGKEKVILFSDSPDGTANLTDCEGQDRYQVYTLSEARFQEVGGNNENKVVTFIAPLFKAARYLPADAVGKGRLSDTVVVWRWGNDQVVREVIDHLIINPSSLGEADMLANWKKSVQGWGGAWGSGTMAGVFHVCL